MKQRVLVSLEAIDSVGNAASRQGIGKLPIHQGGYALLAKEEKCLSQLALVSATSFKSIDFGKDLIFRKMGSSDFRFSYLA